LDDYSTMSREFDYFHPHHGEWDHDRCEFCHHEPSVLDCIHHDSDIEGIAHGFASVVGFIFGIR